MVGLHVAGRPALVVGGGRVATRRAARLAAAGAVVTVVAPEASAELQELAVRWLARAYEPADVEGMVVVVAATDDPVVDAAVVADAEAVGALVNHAGDQTAGSLLVPGEVEAGGIRVAVTTGGQSPVVARWLAGEIERDLLPVAARAAEVLGRLRRELVEAGRSTSHPGWQAAFEAGLVDLIRADDLEAADALVRRHLGLG